MGPMTMPGEAGMPFTVWDIVTSPSIPWIAGSLPVFPDKLSRGT
ncbi:protein of unknown function [Candidatus Promineifilum breve]|uniref:Uncharacterized protein n=1 Tax=Candidatus Promineifilum breve TaxID=1806508 RepID=A0A170PGH8_9CHLR|nr:protein of unknown function [Candidatus Promineifilum breve]